MILEFILVQSIAVQEVIYIKIKQMKYYVSVTYKKLNRFKVFEIVVF